MFFDLEPIDAEQHVLKMARTIASNWKRALRDEGASPMDVRAYADAFEHGEVEKALKLTCWS